ncbi:hypothetical protein KM1_197490 [Entamoeba histolytica HM-3:IMSS]|uniref:Uncharacterized protein n=6 Tax=Entamoeba histolytica TaxID=5759 RepID=C4M243_ENTH1|nr:hypothetical protein EHI_169250 [Entamoeba histolytica HM-1:IMSS]EMD48698.1 Hypothetical protein EHI5A_164820 [Entamoeba histolytica KU27]EMS17053.1 hypothetical protein KM1_197490 [Entamoeba histolytica HM-3:IMSS]ENY63676.1 hypothetical protein EHI7A_138540 [Entamoeba histolytica HM-1:IMSS-A]GAT95331.1 hypothetical protein CL6EHI_169250 [Entamoeba histolytica]EAL45813.1 hypothetical protein EHI_169250 [Entamoeba histolytica HM-1:IMSS]|eukprot:XP_651199.1 hypothetical protein EHI_169250 [Entamoeba histolytica HM-1:IMSS]
MSITQQIQNNFQVVDKFHQEKVQKYTDIQKQFNFIETQLKLDEEALMKCISEGQMKEYSEEMNEILNEYKDKVLHARNELDVTIEKHGNEMKKMNNVFNEMSLKSMSDSEKLVNDINSLTKKLSQQTNQSLSNAIKMTSTVQTKLDAMTNTN